MVKPSGSGSFLRIGAADAKIDVGFFGSLTRGKRPQPRAFPTLVGTNSISSHFPSPLFAGAAGANPRTPAEF